MTAHPVLKDVSGIFNACVPELLAEVQKYQLVSEMARGKRAALCPECQSTWSEREVLAMVKAGHGACMCNKWHFDMNAAAKRAQGA